MEISATSTSALACSPQSEECACLSTKPSQTRLLPHSTTGPLVLVDVPATGDAELADILILLTRNQGGERVFDVMCLTTTASERTGSQATVMHMMASRVVTDTCPSTYSWDSQSPDIKNSAICKEYCLHVFLLVPLSGQNPSDSWQAVCQANRNVMMHMQNCNMDRVLTPIKRFFGRDQHGDAQDTQDGTQPLEEDQPVQELAECEYYMSLGHSTLHHWTPNPQARGVNYDGKTYNDILARVPRPELMADMWSVRPWQHELSDAVTSPHMLVSSFPASFKQPVASSLRTLAPGETAIWTIPDWTGPEQESFDSQGRQIPFTGNQMLVAKNINEILDSFAGERHLAPRSVWVVLETRQSPLHTPSLMFQLDGRAVVRQLRRRMIAVLIDKTGKFLRASITGSEALSFSPTSHWSATMFAILLSSGAEWMPLHTVPIHHVQRPMVHDPGLDRPHHMYWLLTPKEVETKPAFYRYVNSCTESSTTAAKQSSTFPWRNASRLPRPDDTCQLWEYAVPIELTERFQKFLTSEDVATQWISLADPEQVFVLLQAKPRKGGGKNTAVQGPEDLSLELAATLDEELVDEEDLPRGPHLQHIFLTGVPHLKYQRLVTLADES